MSFFNDVYGDRDLSARRKTVCLYLHDRANSEGESWYAIGTIAADLGLSRSTVKRALNDLVRLGRVEKQPRYRENGGQTSNLYRLRKREQTEKQPPHQGEAAPIDWTWGRVIAAHPEGPRRRIIIFREQKYIPLLISPVPVVIQRHFPDMVIGCHAGE